MQNPQHGKGGARCRDSESTKKMFRLSWFFWPKKCFQKEEQNKFFSVFLASKDKT